VMDALLVLLRFVERLLPFLLAPGLFAIGIWCLLFRKAKPSDATLVQIETSIGWRVCLVTKSAGLLCIIGAVAILWTSPCGRPAKIRRQTMRMSTQTDPNSPTGQVEIEDNLIEYTHRDSPKHKQQMQ